MAFLMKDPTARYGRVIRHELEARIRASAASNMLIVSR